MTQCYVTIICGEVCNTVFLIAIQDLNGIKHTILTISTQNLQTVVNLFTSCQACLGVKECHFAPPAPICGKLCYIIQRINAHIMSQFHIKWDICSSKNYQQLRLQTS
jgi:hypothetical protein